jgi:hypothetical protein
MGGASRAILDILDIEARVRCLETSGATKPGSLAIIFLTTGIDRALAARGSACPDTIL